MREAYTLLRQSIIHVEHDVIDFDEEELEGEREAVPKPTAHPSDADDEHDVEMSAGDDTQMDESSMPVAGVPAHGVGAATAGNAAASSSSQGLDGAEAEMAPPPPPPKRRMVITHDKYMTLQSLVVFHLAEVERQEGKGIDRDELIDWYLELKEAEIQDVEELEYEKELITKMLRKLVKVSLFLCPILTFCSIPISG